MKIKLSFFLFSVLFISFNTLSQSPYISKVYDFLPAPGQFVNKLPKYEEGDTHEDMIAKVEECIVGDKKILISLGSYGGYVVFGFDHPVVNVPGQKDFIIWGNAFWAAANPNPDAPKRGGSSEPGIVMVSYDANKNGIPDDEWYELAGSEYNKPETIKNYELTYFRPDENKVKVPMPDEPVINDMTYVKWESNQGDDGYVYRNTFHRQSYYPQWVSEDELVFGGTKLADNYVEEGGNGRFYVQYAYDWGYADNAPNDDDAAKLNIEWAVDADGNSVHLPAIHFVKVYTGVNQYCGWLGESSTEISGAEDLHPEAEIDASNIQYTKQQYSILLINNQVRDYVTIISDKQQSVDIYNYVGIKENSFSLNIGTNNLPISHLGAGLYLIKSSNETIKFIKQ